LIEYVSTLELSPQNEIMRGLLAITCDIMRLTFSLLPRLLPHAWE